MPPRLGAATLSGPSAEVCVYLPSFFLFWVVIPAGPPGRPLDKITLLFFYGYPSSCSPPSLPFIIAPYPTPRVSIARSPADSVLILEWPFSDVLGFSERVGPRFSKTASEADVFFIPIVIGLPLSFPWFLASQYPEVSHRFLFLVAFLAFSPQIDRLFFDSLQKVPPPNHSLLSSC